jgi:hypothetical protein
VLKLLDKALPIRTGVFELAAGQDATAGAAMRLGRGCKPKVGASRGQSATHADMSEAP